MKDIEGCVPVNIQNKIHRTPNTMYANNCKNTQSYTQETVSCLIVCTRAGQTKCLLLAPSNTLHGATVSSNSTYEIVANSWLSFSTHVELTSWYRMHHQNFVQKMCFSPTYAANCCLPKLASSSIALVTLSCEDV